MAKQNFKQSTITFFWFVLASVFVAFLTNNIYVGFASIFPPALSYLTLDFSDNLSDKYKMYFWWPYYLPV